MSETNAQVVRRFVEALVSGQGEDYWQQILADLDNDVAVEDLDISLDTERYRGYNEFLRWIADWSESWGTWRIEGVEVRPAGEDRLIALFLMLVEGRGSGIELSRRIVNTRAISVANPPSALDRAAGAPVAFGADRRSDGQRRRAWSE
jgi:hypothetical protein